MKNTNELPEVESSMTVKASKCLDEKVKKELKKKDPTKEKASAAINKFSE